MKASIVTWSPRLSIQERASIQNQICGKEREGVCERGDTCIVARSKSSYLNHGRHVLDVMSVCMRHHAGAILSS